MGTCPRGRTFPCWSWHDSARRDSVRTDTDRFSRPGPDRPPSQGWGDSAGRLGQRHKARQRKGPKRILLCDSQHATSGNAWGVDRVCYSIALRIDFQALLSTPHEELSIWRSLFISGTLSLGVTVHAYFGSRFRRGHNKTNSYRNARRHHLRYGPEDRPGQAEGASHSEVSTDADLRRKRLRCAHGR